MTDPSRVVVIGGGFAGFWAAVAARRVAEQASIVLIAEHDQLVIRPRLYEAAPATLAVALRPLLELVDVELSVGTAMSADDSSVTITNAADGRSSALGFDALVVATGSVMPLPPIIGAELAHSIDNLQEASRFDEALGRVALLDELVIAVVGAGFTGLELALELRSRLRGHGREPDTRPARIVLIDRADVVGAELGPGPRPVIESALADDQIDTVLSARIVEIGERFVRLADGRSIDADLVVLCTGLVAAPFAASLGVDVDGRGRAIVDRHLRAAGRPDLFVAGDAAVADTGDDHPTLQSCQHALVMGRVAGENAARHVLGEPLVDYAQPTYVTCLDLGSAGAVLTRGWDRAVQRSGLEAKAIKQHINTRRIYPDDSEGREGLLRQSELSPQ